MNNKVWIKASCDNYYKLINKIEKLSIKIYEIKYIEKIIYLKVTKKDYAKIKKYIISYKFKVEKNLGLQRIFDIIKQEKIFVISLIIGLIVFICLKNMIVKINIVHENQEIRELISDELKENKIEILRFKKSYKKLDEIRQKILDKHPDKLDWMEFEIKGMTLNVKVEERIITDTKKNNEVCDIVAKKNGVISDIKILQGESQVLINDYVKEGDTLISGTIKYNEMDKRYTCADGEIYATTWYTGSISIPFKYYEYENESDKRYNLVWEHNGNKHEIFRNRLENFNSNYKTLLKIFDFNLYLDKQVSVAKIEKEYTEEEALNEGVNKVIESVEKKLTKKDTIIDKKVLKKVKNNSTMDIDVFVVVKELISTQKKIEIEKD